MISPASKVRCSICCKRATRAVRDEYGTPLTLCSDCPSPSEIVERAAEVRSRWDETEFICRAHQCCRPHAANVNMVSYDSEERLAVTTWGGLRLSE